MADDKKTTQLVVAADLAAGDLLVGVDVSSTGAVDPAHPGRGPGGTTVAIPVSLLATFLPFDPLGTAAAAVDEHTAAADPHGDRAFAGGAVGAHVATSDPHPQYTTAAEVLAALSSALTGYQPLDSDLTAIAALATTAFGLALLTLADAAVARATLGVPAGSGTSSGTNTGDQDLSGYATTSAVSAGYQPLDADLTAIAALTTTAYGRALLALADAAALRTAAGLGTAATTASTDYAPAAHTHPASAISDSTTAGRTLLTAVDAAAQRVALALATIARSVYLSSPADGTIVVEAKAAFAFTLAQIRGLKTSSGSLTLKVQIGGVDVTGLTGLSVTTTAQDATASAANAVAAGDRVTVVISSSSSPAGLEFTLSATR